MSDFIDRAKLEALAEERYPESDLKVFFVEQFMAGAAAYAAILDAETTEEWAAVTVGKPPVGVISGPLAGGRLAAEQMSARGHFAPVSRRVARTPWLPSEGGEKRG